MTRDELVHHLRAAGCVFAEDEAELLLDAAGGDGDVLRTMLDRRVAGEPLEHVVGWAEFCGLRIAVGPGVFVPRPRTEAIVAHALDLIGDAHEAVVLDLCCGSGAIGVALAHGVRARDRAVELHATDIDPIAVGFARRAIAPYGGAAHVGDLDAPLPESLRGRVAILTANVPYVATGDIDTLPREARDHEPLATLDGGEDGLEVARRVVRLAPTGLAPGGHVLIEVTPAQAPVLTDAARDIGLDPSLHSDEELDATVFVATRR